MFGLGEHGQLGILEGSARTESSAEETPGDASPPVEGDGALEMTPPEKRSLPTIIESLRGKRVVFVAAGTRLRLPQLLAWPHSSAGTLVAHSFVFVRRVLVSEQVSGTAWRSSLMGSPADIRRPPSPTSHR